MNLIEMNHDTCAEVRRTDEPLLMFADVQNTLTHKSEPVFYMRKLVIPRNKVNP